MKGWSRALLLASSLVLGACGGGASVPSGPPATPTPEPTPTPAPAFLVVREGKNSIRSYAVQDAGTLTLRSVAEASPGSFGLLADPSGRLVFEFADIANLTTCCRSSAEVILMTYEMAGDGGLSLSDSFQLAFENSPIVRAVTSRSLYMLTLPEGHRHATFHVLPIDGSSREGTFEAATFQFPSAMAVSPTERSFYVVGSSSGGSEANVNLEGYRLGPDGTSELVQSMTLATTYLQLAIHPSGRFVYAATLANSNPPPDTGQIFIYAADDAGTLSLTGSLPAPVGGLTIHPNGRYLYLSHPQEIDVYGIDPVAGGLNLLEQVQTTALPPGAGSWTFDPSGRFLYGTAGSHEDGQIWGYAIGSNGSLRFLGSLGAGWGTPILVSRPMAQ
jgi:hypothetical protein